MNRLLNSINKYKWLLFLFSIFLLNEEVSWSQKVYFEKYGIDRGLNTSKIYGVIQASNDLLWIGTEEGVSMFNGNDIFNYSLIDGLNAGGVYSLMEDSTGRIWFGHLNGGLSLYDRGKFFTVTIDSVSLTSDVTGIAQFHEYIWITTYNNGVIRIPFPERGKTQLKGRVYADKDGLGNHLLSSYLSKNGDFYCMITNVGVKKYDPQADVFETYQLSGIPQSFIVNIFEDSKGNMWIGIHNGGLYEKVVGTGEVRVYNHSNGLVNDMVSYITEDYKGDIWVGSWGGGVTVISEKGMKVYNKTNGLYARYIHCLYEDKEKNMIIADHYNGLSIYKGDYFLNYNEQNGITDHTVFSIAEDNDKHYWMGFNKGVLIYDWADQTVLSLNGAQNTFVKNVRFLKFHDDRMWIGTEGNGLSYYDIAGQKFVYDTKMNRYLKNIITAFTIDKQGRLWVGNRDQLVRINPLADKNPEVFTRMSGISGNWIKVLFCDDEGNIWIGTEQMSGLTKYDIKKDTFEIINIGRGIIPQTITQTPDSKIWVGTSSGLYRLDNDSIKMFCKNDGLISNNIKLVTPDDGKYLYVGTNYGFNRLNIENGNIASFSKENGFMGGETFPNAILKDSCGNFLFGTAGGIVKFIPDNLPFVDKNPKVYIDKMEVNKEQQIMKPKLKLTSREKSIAFSYYCVSLNNPHAVKYKVMLQGFDRNWRKATSDTFKDYPNLPPGSYVFKVKACNNYGYWSEEPAEYAFTIMSPFYKSLWFLSIIIIVFMSAISMYIKFREKVLIREKKLLMVKVRERTAKIVQTSDIIEEKNKNIMASIRYAEHIQKAILPREKDIENAFVLYLPKDIVSGDFYWVHDDGEIMFVAACDCTGHGVPGAFMSIIGYNSLNRIVGEYQFTQPDRILNLLNEDIIKLTAQNNKDLVTDGMDIALIAFNRASFTLDYAGAFNSLYRVRNNILTTIPADRLSIGMLFMQNGRKFKNNRVDIRPGDMIYIGTDGFIDQFGGPNGSKYKSIKLKKFLVEISSLPLKEQREKMKQEILTWKGNRNQIDDILYIGFRVPGY